MELYQTAINIRFNLQNWKSLWVDIWREETTMRTNHGSNTIKSASVMIRLMRVYDADGRFEPAPVLTHLIRKRGLGLLDGLKLQATPYRNFALKKTGS